MDTSPYKPEDILNATNEYRKSQGLKPLSFNEKLNQAALNNGNDLVKNGYWAHNNPNKGSKGWEDFIKDSGYDTYRSGQNLANGFGDTKGMLESWRNSPTHNANLINPTYSEMGVAIVPGEYKGKKVFYVVQNFGRQWDTPQKVSDNIPANKKIEILKAATQNSGPRDMMQPFNSGVGSGASSKKQVLKNALKKPII